MASPRSERFAITTVMTPVSAPSESVKTTATVTPGSRVWRSPLSDDAIWKRLKESGFDEESIRRRDKAALIAYIAKLEAELFDHQHHMGLLILERKELASKYGQFKASAESAELKYKRDQAAHMTAIAEAKKREDNLKHMLGVEKECIANIEKALHEMRAESAETRVAAECKLAEARSMVEDAQKKFTEAEAKLHAAEALQADASRYHRAAERKLKEVEAREDDLRRRIVSLKSESDAKEREIFLERQALSERQKILEQGQERLLNGQALLSQREDHIFNKSEELNRREKEVKASQMNIEDNRRALNEEISNLELSKASISTREGAVIEKEAMLNKKEQELLILQQKLACKESDDEQKLLADHETVLKRKTSEFDAELLMRRKLVEDEIENKRRAWELREVDLRQREDLIKEREHDLELQSRALQYKESDVVDKLNSLEEKERALKAVEKDIELNKTILQKEQEDIEKKKLELQKSWDSLEERRKQVISAKDKVDAIKNETDEYILLETKLKEEIDMVRAEKLDLMARADELRAEKGKFEAEWEAIDDKRGELLKEAERIAEERVTISKFLKDERDCIKLEKDLIRAEYKRGVESLRLEREEFMNNMVHERSEWLNKIQQERANFLLDIQMQKRALEDLVEKRREELESHFMEKENAFEQEKRRELEDISSRKETITRDLEFVASELKRLDAERSEIKLDRERRDREWVEVNSSIEELKLQRQKLKKQRESLHADRTEILVQIERLKKLEQLEIATENSALAAMHHSDVKFGTQTFSSNRILKQKSELPNDGMDSLQKLDFISNCNANHMDHMQSGSGSPNPSPLSWIRRAAKLIFKQSPEKTPTFSGERSQTSEHEEARLTLAKQLDLSNGVDCIFKGVEDTQKDVIEQQSMKFSYEEPKEVLKMPLSVEIHFSETGDKEDTRENSISEYSEEGLHADRKRKNNSLTSHDSRDTQLNGGKIKKRKQEEDVAVGSSEPIIRHCAVSTKSNLFEEKMSVKQTGGTSDSDPAKLLIVDKLIDITEVASVNTDTNLITTQDKVDSLPNFPIGLEQDTLQEGENNGHAKSSSVGDRDATVQEMLQEPLVGGKHSDQNKFPTGAFPSSSDQNIKDHSMVELDKNEEKEHGMRTRSKQKI